MSMYEDAMVICGVEEPADELAGAIALQRSINSGIVWQLEGSVGRGAKAAIDDGYVMLGRERVKVGGYLPGVVPGRHDVVPGTPGSYEWVVEQYGSEWADALIEGEEA